MKKTIITLTVLATATFAAGTGTLNGRVLYADNYQLAVGANVEVEGTQIGTSVDVNGEYVIPDVPAGRQRLVISMIGYRTRKVWVEVEANRTNFVKNCYLATSPIQMNEVVITGTRTPTPVDESPVLTYLISSEEIEESGAVDAKDILELVPGIEFSTSAHGDDILMRGFNSSYVLILVDGEKQVGRVQNNLDYRRIPSSMIERIEIIPGPSSALYGSEAVGGVINIITKRPKRPHSLNLNLESGSFLNSNLAANYGIKTEKLWGHVSVSGTGSQGYDLTPETISHTSPPYLVGSSNAKLTWTPADALSLGANFNFFHLNQWDTVEKQGGIYDETRMVYTITPGLNGSYTFADSSSLGVKVSYSDYENENRNDRRESETLDIETQTYDYLHTELLYNFPIHFLGEHDFVVGAEYQREGAETPRLAEPETLSDVIGFVQNHYNPFPSTGILAGVRVERQSQYGLHATPRFSVKQSVGELLSLRATLGWGFRAPDLKQLYIDFSHGGSGPFIKGNPDLEPETSIGGDVSAELGGADWKLVVNVYRNDLTNVIYVAPVEDEHNTYSYENIGSACSQGFSTDAIAAPFGFLKLSSGVAYNQFIDEETGEQVPYQPQLTGSGKIDLDFASIGFSTTLIGRYSGPRTWGYGEDADQAPGYVNLGVRLSQRFFKKLKVYTHIDNLLGFTDANYYTMSGTTFKAGVNWEVLK